MNSTQNPISDKCDICHKPSDDLAICHVPGKQAANVCKECRTLHKYKIIDPNHPEFMLG